jgi:hypothetical protein
MEKHAGAGKQQLQRDDGGEGSEEVARGMERVDGSKIPGGSRETEMSSRDPGLAE